MKVKEAAFVISNTKLSGCPTDGRSEYAFIGRSNVGKSSLINMLLGQRGLAKTSQKPGKTLLINHFIVNDSFYVVDLPGYGFAKIDKKTRGALEGIISSYILQRQELANLFLLIDIRHKPLKIDLDFMHDLGENGVPFAIIFTKADKLSKMATAKNVEAYKQELLQEWEELPPIFVSSAETGLGRDEILDYIERIESASEEV